MKSYGWIILTWINIMISWGMMWKYSELKNESKLAYDNLHRDMQINQALHEKTIEELKLCRRQKHY